MKKAVVLFSGGLDSTTVLYLAKKGKYSCFCLTFNYGQRHKREIKAAREISKKIDFPLREIKIALPWAKDALVNKKKNLPKRKLKSIPRCIPSTYVSARNTIFLSFALSLAESIGAEAIFIGANARDWSGYPDCTPAYFKAWQKLIKTGTKTGSQGKKIEIITPLLNKTKGEIVKIGKKLDIPFQLTWSCYKGENYPCGLCDSCQLRTKGFKEAGMIDPLLKNKNFG